MARLARHTLFWKYALYFSGLISALLVVSGTVGGYFAFRQSTAALDELQRTKAGFAAGEIETFIGRIESALQSTIAKFHMSEVVGEEDLRLELIALMRHLPAITEVHWIDGNGSERLTLSRIGRDAMDSRQDWSKDALFQLAHARRTYVGPVSFRGGSEPYLSLADSRDAAGPVLVAEINLKFVGDVISKIHTGRKAIAYVVDAGGHLISHPDPALVLGNTDFSRLPQVRRAFDHNGDATASAGAARNVEGVAVLAAAVPIEHLGWTVFAEQPLDEALRPVYASLATSIALVLLGLLAAVAASLVLARHMVRPIRQIAAGAREIGEGRLDRRIDVKTGDELETLGVQFNCMAARLQETYATQESRIAERTRDLALANEAKTRFVAVASHDLRQPIHALALFVGQLRAIPASLAGQALLERIEGSVDALEELLEALLDLSKLDVGTVIAHSQAFPIHDLLSRLVADFAPEAEAKDLALTLVPTSLWVRSDPLLLERILRNLVTNAIRYTAEGRVLIGCLRRNGHVDLVVADSGVGIARLHLPNIFQEFYRAGPLQPGLSKGLGLGLAIVKRLTRLLDHAITVRSLPGRGTLVRVRVPRAVPEERAVAARKVVTDLRGTRVLIVDDEVAARDALAGLLTQWGCEVDKAERGAEALEHARRCRPDVVLCDLNLADGENGLQVVDRLRSEHGVELACAFVTGESGPEHVAEARQCGYLIAFKPTKPAKLRALIEHMMTLRTE